MMDGDAVVLGADENTVAKRLRLALRASAQRRRPA
jgi:hypothetical protein